MAVGSYGTIVSVPGGMPVRRAAWMQLALAGAAVCALAVGCVLVATQSGPTALAQVQTTSKLLGFDPFNSNRQPGKQSASTLGAFEQDENSRDPLPSWATEWSDESHETCEVGAQCDHGNLPNPLGTLGLWVMRKTSSHFNSPYDEYRRHKCANLPGWALEECHRMRNRESELDEEGNAKEGSEDKARPMLLHEYRMHPALRRSLPARWQHMRKSHMALASEAAFAAKAPHRLMKKAPHHMMKKAPHQANHKVPAHAPNKFHHAEHHPYGAHSKVVHYKNIMVG